jgi:WD40 repeat protein
MSLYDIQTQSRIAEVIMKDNQQLLDYSPDTRLLATTQDQQTLELSDIESGEVRSTLTPGYPIYNAVFLPGGRQIAILDANEMAFSIWDIDSAEELNSYSGFESAAPVYSIAFSDDGKTAMWYARATVQTTRLSSGQMGPVLSHQEFIGGLDMAPEENLLAAASATTTGSEPQAIIQLWNAGSGEKISEFKGCEIIPISVDFSKDGKLLAADCQNKVIIWDVNGLNILAEPGGHTDSVTSVKFSPDGTMLASAANDDTIVIWTVQQQ